MTARRCASTLAVLLACLTLTASAVAEQDAYLKIKGAKLGDIKGGVTLKGREHSIEVTAIEHQVTVPTDVGSGMATGKRQHKPLVITKPVDQSSPLLHTALATNENLSEVTLQFYRMNNKGAEENYYTITLKNARIVGIRHVMHDNTDATKQRLPAQEEISFSYAEITWTWTDGGVTSTDSVVTPK